MKQEFQRIKVQTPEFEIRKFIELFISVPLRYFVFYVSFMSESLVIRWHTETSYLSSICKFRNRITVSGKTSYLQRKFMFSWAFKLCIILAPKQTFVITPAVTAHGKLEPEWHKCRSC